MVKVVFPIANVRTISSISEGFTVFNSVINIEIIE